MAELILGVSVILGSVFIIGKLISGIARVFELDEITRLMSRSMSMRTGNFSSKQQN